MIGLAAGHHRLLPLQALAVALDKSHVRCLGLPMTRRIALLALLALVILLLPARASALDPESFSTIASGVVKIKATHCKGGGYSLGSGFLLGTSVVMTAHHVVAACRQVDVLVKNTQWIPVAASTHWFDAKDALDALDAEARPPHT